MKVFCTVGPKEYYYEKRAERERERSSSRWAYIRPILYILYSERYKNEAATTRAGQQVGESVHMMN